MPTPAKKSAMTPIPVQLSKTEFNQFILPHWTCSSFEAVLRDLKLATSSLEVTRATDDSDNDSVPDPIDLCSNTASGDPVDTDGCSVDQFCDFFDASTKTGERACKAADWQDDEPTQKHPSDCKVQKQKMGKPSICMAAVPTMRECSDGIDNDGDGLIDFGADPQCRSLDQVSEKSPGR